MGVRLLSDNAAADGTETNQVKVAVVDGHDNPVPNQTVTFTADNSATIIDNAITDANGLAIASLTSLKAGESTVTCGVATISGLSKGTLG
ncbi:MAG: Ig-like domain-containing protein [Sodalis sp. (in: enterobacteria)]|uniref:Ig-like domain-containing protein n=1 Tax=Sodalis sp. (in: enterobacteria) TaxID=1898979 RepID=UPI0039E39113